MTDLPDELLDRFALILTLKQESNENKKIFVDLSFLINLIIFCVASTKGTGLSNELVHGLEIFQRCAKHLEEITTITAFIVRQPIFNNFAMCLFVEVRFQNE